MLRRNVGEGYDEDNGRSICRLDPDSLLELNIMPGDIVRISGEYDTYTKVWRSNQEDWNENQVLVDEFVLYNIQAEIGDVVEIEKVSLGYLDHVTLLPYRGENIEFRADSIKKLKQQHIKKPVDVGTLIGTELNDFEYLLPLVVTGSHQTDPGVITESTTIKIPDPYLTDSASE